MSNPNQVAIVSDGPVPGNAILAMGWAPGWVGSTGPIEWLGAVHARVPAEEFDDTGRAVLRYEPRSFRHGLFLTVLGVGLLLALGVAATTRRRASDVAGPPVDA